LVRTGGADLVVESKVVVAFFPQDSKRVGRRAFCTPTCEARTEVTGLEDKE
jgi:hypothetical protein